MEQHWHLQQIAAIQYAAAMEQQRQQLSQFHAPLLGPFGPPMPPLVPPLPPLPPLPRDVSSLVYNVDSEEEEDDDNSEEKRTVFCANLDDRVTEELLYEVFLQAGPIESVRIPKDNTGKQRSFGFVTFVHSCTPAYAMELLKGLALFRRTITIKYQGSTNIPPPRRAQPLPGDCEVYARKRGSHDYAAQRNTNQPSYYDTSMNDASSSAMQNPFKQSKPDWTLGSGAHKEKERISKHCPSRLRAQHSTPYARPESSHGGRSLHEHERSQQHRREHQHGGSNRRSEQRSGRRR